MMDEWNEFSVCVSRVCVFVEGGELWVFSHSLFHYKSEDKDCCGSHYGLIWELFPAKEHDKIANNNNNRHTHHFSTMVMDQ